MIVRPSDRARCCCETATIPVSDGEITAVVTLSRDCSVHSFPNDKWRDSSHLLKHAGYIERKTGAWYASRDAHDAWRSIVGDGGWPYFQGLFRRETPSEVEARLLDELS